MRDSSGLHELWRSFREGLVRRSLPAAAGGVLLGVSALLGAGVWLEAYSAGVSFRRSPLGDRLPYDDHNRMEAVKNAEALWDENSSEQRVLYISGSSGWASIKPFESLSATLSAVAGKPVKFTALAGVERKMSANLVLIDYLAHRWKGLLVLVFWPGTLSEQALADDDEPWGLKAALMGRDFPFDSPALREVARPVLGWRAELSRSALIRHLSLYRDIIVWRLRQAFEGYWPHTPASANAVTPAPCAEMSGQSYALTQADLPLYKKGTELGASLLRRTIALAKAQGVGVLLVESPYYEGAFAPSVLSFHRQQLASIASEEGVVYRDLNREAKISSNEFSDWLHVCAKGRLKYRPLFLRTLKEVLVDSR